MAHVLVVPYPSQGHINPMLQFSKRLASKGPTTTLVTTRFIINTFCAQAAPVCLAAISDGHDDCGFSSAVSLEAYLDSLDQVGSRTLSELIEERHRSGCPFTCVVYDSFVPWVPVVAKRHGLPAVAFSTQSCAVSAVYYYVGQGMFDVPVAAGDAVSVAGLPPMERWEFPSFACRNGLYPALEKFALTQFNLNKADWVLFNSFDELESEVVACLKTHWHARTIGPCVPLTSVDVHAADATMAYGINLLEAEQDVCMKWLSTKPTASVVYVSFGSFASLGPKQMQELASALRDCNKYFLWVVRSTEEKDLPGDFLEKPPENGLVVKWSPQLDVLAHEAMGCFVTHCGWNSTLEAMSSGVPMVAIGLWTDQPTNAKYIEDVWGIGVRAKAGEGGVFTREEIERCVKEVMEGEKGEEIKRNAKKWKELAKEAVREGGGSSDENLNEFVEFVNAKAESMKTVSCDETKPSEKGIEEDGVVTGNGSEEV